LLLGGQISRERSKESRDLPSNCPGDAVLASTMAEGQPAQRARPCPTSSTQPSTPWCTPATPARNGTAAADSSRAGTAGPDRWACGASLASDGQASPAIPPAWRSDGHSRSLTAGRAGSVAGTGLPHRAGIWKTRRRRVPLRTGTNGGAV